MIGADNDLVTVTVSLPLRHATILDELAAELEQPRGQIVAQALATLQAVHLGVWRIENNQTVIEKYVEKETVKKWLTGEENSPEADPGKLP